MGQSLLLSDFATFFDRFSSLFNIGVPEFPPELLTPRRLTLLQTARSISFLRPLDQDHFTLALSFSDLPSALAHF